MKWAVMKNRARNRAQTSPKMTVLPWMIVAAAGKYQAIDEQLGQASEEELEALAEANMWKTIATHSMESGAETDDSAVAATDWAISRSLEQIENATGEKTGSDQSV
mmetsp:Transcript_6487/g.9465  ORF Transcript_6487/g.9465 Transcript_6487/m.9465 type:complete len:106 (+) Transcript_6487:302-619(+)